MVDKEFYSGQEAAGNEESTLLQDPYEEEEEEEALSLSDLPIYTSDSISAQWGDFSKEDGNNNSRSNNNNNDDDEDDDFFEFFSEEFTTSTSATAENIIFCGKLIPFKDPPHEKAGNKSLEISNTLLPWRRNSFHKAKPPSRTVTSSDDGIASFKKRQEAKGAESLTRDHYSSVGKVSLLRSTTKSRWFLFMFGMSRLSNTHEMELSDIRSRQSRSRRGPVAAPEHGGEVMIKGRRNCKGLWKVLRSMGFGCKSSSKLADDVVKAAFV